MPVSPNTSFPWPPPTDADDAVVGRDDELAALGRFLSLGAAAPVPLTVLAGEVGIGKTVLWRAALDLARRDGWQILSAAPAEAETTLSFAALGDLLEGAADADLAALDVPQRYALEVALLRREPDGPPPDVRAIGVAVLALLHQYAERRPLLLALDDVQWLDPPSAAVLAFAMRRGLGPRVRVLATLRSGHAPAGPVSAVLDAAQRLELGPLSLGATQQLLRSRLEQPLSHAELRRIQGTANGNPLHALEIARAAVSGGRVPGTAMFAPPQQLAELVRSRVRTLPATTRETLLAVAALSRPDLDVLRRIRGADVDADVDRAVGSGLLRVDGARLRFAHPLFASACYHDASESARRSVHRLLADALADPEERARHLALASEPPDDAVAAALEGAAEHARRRGAVESAGELMALSVTFSGGSPVAVRGHRARSAAHWLMAAGDAPRAATLLRSQVDDPADDTADGTGPELVRNLIALSAVVYELEGTEASRALSLRAIEQAGEDPILSAEARLSYAERSHLCAAERLEAVTWALKLLGNRPGVAPAVEARALRELALANYHLGRGLPRDLIDRATVLERTLPEPLPLAWRARTCLGECLKYVDEFAESQRILAETARLAERHSDVITLATTRAHQAELALWLGDWQDADRYATQAAELAEQSDQHGRLAFALTGRLLLAGCRGEVTAARELGRQALAAAQAAGDAWAQALTAAATGFAELSAGEPAAAVAALARADEVLEPRLLTAPRQWRYLEDYVEALVATGEVDRAAERLGRLERWAREPGPTWPRVMAARARGLVLEARGDRAGALGALEEAEYLAAELPLPFVRARISLTLAGTLRRDRSKRRARALLDEAVAGFDALGAAGWADRARAEASRISGRSAAAGRLTETEQRVAALVAEGHSNKEVAAALFVTPRTVEAHLTRVYAKLGVRSRAELARQSVGVSALPPHREQP
ncbi:MAG: ATP-binding protein [Nocardioidaceae bacterium]